MLHGLWLEKVVADTDENSYDNEAEQYRTLSMKLRPEHDPSDECNPQGNVYRTANQIALLPCDG